MAKSLLLLHVLNGLVGSLCIAILGLTTHAIVIKDQVDPLLPGNITSTGMGMLMWAGCGGIVDMLLFLGLISGKSARDHAANPPSALYRNIILFVAAFILLRPLIILSYTYTENNTKITPENWGCNIGSGSNAHSLCHELRAARYLLIPVLVLAAGQLTTMLRIRFRSNMEGTDDRSALEAQSK